MSRMSFYAAFPVLFLWLALAAPQVWSKGEAPKNIDINAAHALMTEQPSGLVIVDVRTPQEYLQGHLQGARNLDFTSPAFVEEAKSLPKDSLILLYCRAGTRSAGAARLLRKEGYTRIMDMQGGIDAWQRAALPVETRAPARQDP